MKTRPILLDASPLGLFAKRHPAQADEQRLSGLIAAGTPVLISEVADFEVRRGLLLHRLAASIVALDALKTRLWYLPISTSTMLRAAELWADARRAGRSTADPKSLDGDVIIAAQALEADAIVATENVRHLARFVDTVAWHTIVPPPPSSP